MDIFYRRTQKGLTNEYRSTKINQECLQGQKWHYGEWQVEDQWG